MDGPDPRGPTTDSIYHLTGSFQLGMSSDSCLGRVLSSSVLTCFPVLALDSLGGNSPAEPPPHSTSTPALGSCSQTQQPTLHFL